MKTCLLLLYLLTISMPMSFAAVSWIGGWNTVAITGEDTSKCCMPKYFLIQDNDMIQSTTPYYQIDVKLPLETPGCQALSLSDTHLPVYAKVADELVFNVPQENENLNMDLTFDATTNVYSVKQTATGKPACTATLTKYTYPAHWIHHWRVLIKDYSCCPPERMDIKKLNDTFYTVTGAWYDATQCTKNGFKSNFIVNITAAQLASSFDVSVGADTITISLTHDNVTNDYTYTQTGGTAKCVGIMEPEDVTWQGGWEISSVTAEPAADVSKCCLPSSVIVKPTPNKTQGITVTGSLPVSSAGCQAAGITTATFSQQLEDFRKIQVDLGTAQSPVILTFRENEYLNRIAVQQIGAVTCQAVVTRVATGNWNGAWSVTKSDGQSDKCCYPMSNIEINDDFGQTLLEGRWEDSPACQAINFARVIWVGKVDMYMETSNELNFNIRILANNIVTGQIVKTGTATNSPTNFTITNSGVSCTGTLALSSRPVPFKPIQWVGNWTVGTGQDAACCYPTGIVRIGMRSAAQYKVKGTFENSTACKTANLVGVKWNSVAGAKEYAMSMDLTVMNQAKKQGTLGVLPKMQRLLMYQGGTAVFSLPDNSCPITLTNPAYKNTFGFPGDDYVVDSGSTWIYVVVILIIVIVVAIGCYCLYNRRRVAKLNQSITRESQQTLLGA